MADSLNIIIRPEVSNDLPGIFALNSHAFGQDNEAILVDVLRRTDAFIPNLSLMAIYVMATSWSYIIYRNSNWR